ncbi:MAG: sugar transferase [Acidobacteriota bacterium]|nr:sugar transferase [Acidobacteriota bacterium]
MIRLFRVSIPNSTVELLISEAIVVVSCYVLAAFASVDVSLDIFLLEDGGWWRIGLVAVFILGGLYLSDLYDQYRIASRTVLLQQFCLVVGVAFLFQALLDYGRWDLGLPRHLMIYGSLLLMVAGPSWRILFTGAVRKARGAQKLLFLGASTDVRQIIQALRERPELGMTPIGVMDSGGQATPPEGVPWLGVPDQLSNAFAENHADRIVVGMMERRGSLPVEQLVDLRFAGIQIEDAAATYETVFHRVSVRELRPSQLIFSVDLGPRPAMVAMQTAYSWILGLATAVAALPIMVLVALAVRFSSQGPVLYRQTRMGKYGIPFTIYKFRSMKAGAEASSGAVWASKDDPRVTPVGRWLRKLRLDELPQLFNVLRGDMSLVGPRPERPEFVNVLQQQIPYYRQRLCVKPGVTGWAQINHKYGDTMEDAIIKLEYDLYYIKNLAPSLDAYIIFHTAKTVLLGRGAQ